MAVRIRGKKLAVLGAGKLGGILLRAFLKKGLVARKDVVATVKHSERVSALRKSLGIRVGTDNHSAVKGADIILICVKPQLVKEVLEEIRDHIPPNAIVISTAASVPTSYLESHLGRDLPVIRT